MDIGHLIKVGIDVIREVQIHIFRRVAINPKRAFSSRIIVAGEKKLLHIDDVAESLAEERLHVRLKLGQDRLFVIGEESLSIRKEEGYDLTGEIRLIVLLDMIDGTDLLERGLSNWCSAMVFLDPQANTGQKILAALVGLPNDGVYYARRDRDHVWKYRFHVHEGAPREIEFGEGLPALPLTESSICFYGQQIGALASVIEGRQFLNELRPFSNLRIYNLAGNPMMVRMVDGHHRIDAVFDAHGQQPHDFVAGTYIAAKSGATLIHLADGTQPINLEECALHPSNPDFKKKYIIASHEALALELRRCLSVPIITSTTSPH